MGCVEVGVSIAMLLGAYFEGVNDDDVRAVGWTSTLLL